MIALTRGKKWGMPVCHPAPSAIFSIWRLRQAGEDSSPRGSLFRLLRRHTPAGPDASTASGHADFHVEVIVSPCPPVYAFREARLIPWLGSVCHCRFAAPCRKGPSLLGDGPSILNPASDSYSFVLQRSVAYPARPARPLPRSSKLPGSGTNSSASSGVQSSAKITDVSALDSHGGSSAHPS